MNQEIKDKLEQAAAYHQGSGLDFMAGAQTILKNPSEWGLVGAQWKEDAIHNADTAVEIAAERNRYRGQLDKILTEYEAMESKHNHVETWYESHIQKEKYKEVLERLLEENMCSHAGDELIEEALKTGGKQ